MHRMWSIIPEYEHREASMELALAFGAAFEYNDFFQPKVYEDEAEVKARIQNYSSLPRSRERDTVHGVFLDMAAASTDRYLREYSRKRMRQSVEIADRLGAKGVVFHSSLIRGLQKESYLTAWADQMEEWFSTLLRQYPNIELYLENTFEETPEPLLGLAERLKEYPQFGLCFDYAHAFISGSPVEEWTKRMAPYVKHLHINDNDGRQDLHRIPGTGVLNWSRFAEETKGLEHCTTLVELDGIEAQRKALRFLENI